MKDRQIIVTADGSTTIYLPERDECYHSKNGAIQETYHVFIKHGLDFFEKKEISILEMGFGTGLNAFITFIESQKRKLKIDYTGVEAFPLSVEEAGKLNFVERLEARESADIFDKMHLPSHGTEISLSESFSFTKLILRFEELELSESYDLIYFDAFGFGMQPELWSAEIFEKMYSALSPNGILVTYAARSVIKRNMQAAGFRVEKLPGALGKREMFRALK